MSLSGPEALRSLEDALRDIRREEDEIAKRLGKSAEMVTKIRETESELLRELAKLRLDPAVQGEVDGRLSQAEARARDMLKQHAADLSSAETDLKALDRQVNDLSAERARLVTEEGQREAELKRIADQVLGPASSDPDYRAKYQDAQELTKVAEEALRKTETAEADRAEKGQPYRDDPLFMYLWDRKFGTKDYKAGGLTRMLDSWVARLVGYPEARPNYAMLNEIPLRLREHAERQHEAAKVAQDEILALEAAAIDAAGGKPVRDALAAVEARIAEIDAEIVRLEDKRDETAQRQRDLAQGSDPAFSAAIQHLADALGREDIHTLIAQARATQTGQDDTIVKQIDDARSRAQEEENETVDQKARLKTLASRRRELEDIQFEFKKQGFDNPRSTFREDKLVGDILTDFLRGGITAGSYWDQWRRSQHWQAGQRNDDRNSHWGGGNVHWPDSSFGGGSGGGGTRRSSSGGGFGGSWGHLPKGPSSGGGFSRPRGGSQGTRQHGGFKTGGGF